MAVGQGSRAGFRVGVDGDLDYSVTSDDAKKQRQFALRCVILKGTPPLSVLMRGARAHFPLDDLSQKHESKI